MTTSGETASTGLTVAAGRMARAIAAISARIRGRAGARRVTVTTDDPPPRSKCRFGIASLYRAEPYQSACNHTGPHLRRCVLATDERGAEPFGRLVLVQHRDPDAALPGHLDRPVIPRVHVPQHTHRRVRRQHSFQFLCRERRPVRD